MNAPRTSAFERTKRRRRMSGYGRILPVPIRRAGLPRGGLFLCITSLDKK